MNINEPILFDLESIKKAVIRKFPLIADCFSNIKFIKTNNGTASTDGKNIYYNPQFLNTLTFDGQIFTIAHEGLHIAFDHIERMKNSNYKISLWNTATDAVINQALESENLPIPEGFINIPEAKNKCADDVYNKLLKNYNDKKVNADYNRLPQESEKEIDDYAKQFGNTVDDHKIWQNNPEQEKQDTSENKQIQGSELEKNFTNKNKNKKQELSKKIIDEINNQKNKAANYSHSHEQKSGTFGELGKSKGIVNWKKILTNEFDDYQRQWSNRRATKENGWSSRIVSIYQYEKARTEVLLDTSYSVNDKLLKSFIRQLKTILKDSQLFVGCFDTKFYGFQEITSDKDVDQFVFKGRGGTDFNLAVNSFTNDDKINKIVFTDGDSGKLPGLSTMNIKKLYWIKFGESQFEPCCGKIIEVDEEQIIQDDLSQTSKEL